MNRPASAVARCAALLLVSASAQAAPILFDFENLPIPTETPFTAAAAGLSATFAGPSDVDPGAFGISSNFPSPTGFQYRLLTGDFLTIGSAFGASGSALTITFSAPVTSLTFDFALDDPADRSDLTLMTDAGDAFSTTGALTAGFRYPEGIYTFAGAPFRVLTIASTADDFQLDNLRVTAQAVPEPETVALLGLGLAAFAVHRRPIRWSLRRPTPKNVSRNMT